MNEEEPGVEEGDVSPPEIEPPVSCTPKGGFASMRNSPARSLSELDV